MLESYQHFNLKEKTILERMVFRPPLTGGIAMPNDACFLFTIKGQSTVIGPSQQVPLKTNEGVVLKCGSYLNKWAKTKDNSPCEAVAIHFGPDLLKAIFKDELPGFITEKRSVPRICIQKVQLDAMLGNYMESLLFYFDNPSLVNDELLSLKVKELILLLAKTENAQQIYGLLQGLFDPVQFSFKEIVRNNLYQSLTLDNWAILTGMSTSTFKRKFSEAFGESPARYIRHKKLEHAAELLTTTQQRISDIAFQCGFTDMPHFAKSFSGKFGMSATDFRAKNLA